MSAGKNGYYITLTGAKKNVGDFLITERALALLEKVAPEYKFIKCPHWEVFDDMEFVNNSEGIIILGGPGFQMDMYPGIYKLSNSIGDIHVPIFTLGVGWKGIPGDTTTENLYEFTESAKQLLDNLEKTYAGMSCRDYQTMRTLNNSGYKNITMTGCPAWYDIESIGKEFQTPKEFKKIIFTPAQDYMYSDQSIEMMFFLSEKFKNSQVIVSFHRGIGEVDECTPEEDAINTQKIADYALELGFEVVDTAYNTNKMDFYDKCDLHIGYRVHAHIYFLSKRLPSILIHEDGRGNGVSEALKSPGIDAYRVSKFYSKMFSPFRRSRFLLRVYSRIGMKLNKNVIIELNKTIEKNERNNYSSYKEVSGLIDRHYIVMEDFIRKMIYKEKS